MNEQYTNILKDKLDAASFAKLEALDNEKLHAFVADSVEFFLQVFDVDISFGYVDGHCHDEVVSHNLLVDVDNVDIGFCHCVSEPGDDTDLVYTGYSDDANLRLFFCGHFVLPARGLARVLEFYFFELFGLFKVDSAWSKGGDCYVSFGNGNRVSRCFFVAVLAAGELI